MKSDRPSEPKPENKIKVTKRGCRSILFYIYLLLISFVRSVGATILPSL